VRFFTSDLHFGHANIREYCPDRLALGPDVDAMNEELIARWNETVGPSDLVVIVGDLVMGKKALTLPLLTRLNGTKELLPGNHDAMFHKQGEKYRKAVEMYEAVGVHVLHSDMYHDNDLDGHRVLVCHFPYSGESQLGVEDRYPDDRPVDRGEILIHGHVHDMWKINGRMINVGVDVWDYRPVAETAIGEIVAGMR
jgi:calcineurin-like phosphoesterase family protein